jgi:hypothetical protein
MKKIFFHCDSVVDFSFDYWRSAPLFDRMEHINRSRSDSNCMDRQWLFDSMR